MLVGIHQLHYLPWLRYFEKIARSDVFIVLDDIQFTKNGWQNRNKVKSASGVTLLTVPVRAKLGQTLDQVQINNAAPWRKKHWRTIQQCYAKAPHFNDYAAFLEQTYAREWECLNALNRHMLEYFIRVLGIAARVEYASELDVPGAATERLVNLVKAVGGDSYYTGAFALESYLDVSLFEEAGVEIEVQEWRRPEYPQTHGDFAPDLAIVDLLMNCGPDSLDILMGRQPGTDLGEQAHWTEVDMIPHSKPCIGEEEAEAVARVLRSGMLAQGPEVEAFESECAKAVGRAYGVAVSSGTAALHLALGALGVVKDEPVAVPSYACAALVTAVHLQQARPVLCDIGDDYNLDPAAVDPSCRVIIVPHLFGGPARLPAAGTVLEDIAQSMGGATGRASPVAITSFYATKLMTTGEGGMLLTDDSGVAEYARDRRDYDNRDDFVLRYPYKMTDFQAALGRVQLSRLPEFVARRSVIAACYQDALADLPLRLPNPEGHVFFRYVMATEQRDALAAHLLERGVEAKRPVYRPAHHYLGGQFPGAERAHQQCLSIPIYPSLVEADVERVIESVRSFFN